MLRVEGALARVEGALGIIPAASGRAIERAAGEVAIDPAALAPGMASAGVPVAALVAAFRARARPRTARGCTGAPPARTSSTPPSCCASRGVLDLLDARLARLIAALAEQAGATARR